MIPALHDEPKFSSCSWHLLTRNSRIEEDLIDQLFNSSERRLARSRCCSRISGRGRPQPISRTLVRKHWRDDRHHPIPRQPFLEQVSQTRLISYNGHIEVHNSLLSAVLHEKRN
jgi:hypothetical protein